MENHKENKHNTRHKTLMKTKMSLSGGRVLLYQNNANSNRLVSKQQLNCITMTLGRNNNKEHFYDGEKKNVLYLKTIKTKTYLFTNF